MNGNFLLEDKFTILSINKDGKFFKKVSRVDGKSEIYEIEMQLDINTEIYPVNVKKDYMLVLAGSETLEHNLEETNKSQLIDDYEYVMYGKVFKVQEIKKNELNIFISFGGLLMNLKGANQHLKNIVLETRLYLLMKQV